MSQVILLNKPFHVLSQFTDREQPDNPRTTLADFLDAPSFRPAGRLDEGAEGAGTVGAVLASHARAHGRLESVDLVGCPQVREETVEPLRALGISVTTEVSFVDSFLAKSKDVYALLAAYHAL